MPKWPWRRRGKTTRDPAAGGSDQDAHLALARESLAGLIDDDRIPAPVRSALAGDYASVKSMLDKLEHGHLHIAVFGRVSVGKSSLLNALTGEERFSASPLHGETKTSDMTPWTVRDADGVFLIDTPGINEVDGEARERMAHEVAARSDLVLFVVDGDLSAGELDALEQLSISRRPVLLVLNKADRYTSTEMELLLDTLRARAGELVSGENVLPATADPAPQTIVNVLPDGTEKITERPRNPDVVQLKNRIWAIIETEGKTLAALNASLFASDLSDQVAARILDTRRALGEKVLHTYCLAKGVAVALNPIPVADLFAAAFMDVTMAVHLSRVYNLPLTKTEAGSLVTVIATQAVTLMGTVWGVHLVSSALKVGTGGVSTVVTAGAQGAVAYYSTHVVGKVTEEYLMRGKSWGEGGPKRVVTEILENLDRDSILRRARDDIRAHLRAG